uniref:Uncharacterized protein n=1 Tax=Arundo donax TaxID=35708 RepID=A0A0A8ZBJ2_ARUDO
MGTRKQFGYTESWKILKALYNIIKVLMFPRLSTVVLEVDCVCLVKNQCMC